MKKKQIIILSISIIILLIFLSEKQQKVSLDDTLIDVTQFTTYKGLNIDWVSNGKRYNPYGFGEKSVVSEGWSKNGNNYTSYRFFQHTLLYRNKIVAAFAFRLFSPNNVYKDEWPNYYDSSWDLTNKGTIDLNANRYIYYCGIGDE